MVFGLYSSVNFLTWMGIFVLRDVPQKIISGKHRYFALFLVLILFSSSFIFGINVKSDQPNLSSQIICHVSFKSPEFFDVSIKNIDFTYVKMQDCISYADEGKPVLPVYPAQILIPYGKKVTDVQVVFDDFIFVRGDLNNKPLAPQQEPLPFSVENDDSPIIIDYGTYASTDPVFEDIFTIGSLGYCRGYSVLTVFLYPVKYIPKEGLLYYTSNMNILVSVDDENVINSDQTNMYLRGLNSDKQLVSSLVENPGYIESYDSPDLLMGDESFEFSGGLCDPADTFEYVIITSSALSDTTSSLYNWSDLISHRQSYSGLSGMIVTVEEIDACADYWNETVVFNDTQAHIREFLKDAYDDWETEYVLLGGDWDSTESNQVVPYREFTDTMETETYDSMACDLYYSHLDGDWYFSDETVWGGGKNSGVNDLFGELFVGRITVSSGDEVSNAVYKIINYDTNASLSTDWLRSVSFWGGSLGWVSTSKQYMEELRLGTDTYRTFTGFEEWNDNFSAQQFDTSERLYHADLGSGYTTYFSNSVEDDNASIINHLDHSSWNSPMGLIGWVSRFNTKPFLGYSQGCLAGRYQEGDSGCEWLICNYEGRHAYGLVLNTGYGYGSGSTTDGASQYVMAYFWDYFFNNQSLTQENWQLGKAMNYAKGKISSVIDSRSHAWCYAWYSGQFFGDPAQTLRLNSSYDSVLQTSPSPSNGSMDIAVDTSVLSIDLADPNGDGIDWSIETSPDIGSSTGNSEANGSKTCSITNLNYSTNYTWYVNATDGVLWTRNYYTFTTSVLDPANNAPVLSNSDPSNSSLEVSVGLSTLSLTITDLEGDSINWSIETSPNIGNNAGNNDTNGSKTCSITGLVFDNAYSWFVNASDGYNWTNNSYQFTTRGQYDPEVPSSFTAGSNGRFQIDLSWTNGNDADYTYVEYGTSDTPWDRGTGTELYDDTGSFTSDPDLNLDTTRYYQAWSYNSTDDVWSSEYASCNGTTNSNNAPSFGVPNPVNGSTDENASFTWTILISDDDGDSFNWTVECSDGQSNNVNDDGNGSKQLTLNDLTYETTFYIWVNATDGYDWTRAWYSFTTRVEPNLNQAPSLSSISPSNGSTGVSTSLSTLSISIEDPDGDVFNWSIETSPNIGSNNVYNDSNSSKTCTLSNLEYSTTYYWYVNVSDGNHTVNNFYHFRTSSPPASNPNVGGSSSSSENSEPLADAGGPYTGFVDEAVIFDGSGSNDSDGTIALYEWDFGDGNSSTGQTVDHIYSAAGNYTAVLTVTDNDDDTGTDSTTVTVTENISDTGGLPSTDLEPTANDVENADDDNDGIINIVEEQLGSNTLDESDVEPITQGSITHYLVDTNGDGRFDVFYNSKSEIVTKLGYASGNAFLIDTDGDGDWDYTYNLALGSISSYSDVSENEHPLMFFIKPYMLFMYLIILLSVCIVLFAFRYRISLYLIERRLSLINPKVHYFSESDDDEENDDEKLTQSFEDIEEYDETEDADRLEEGTFSIKNIEETIDEVQEQYEEESVEDAEIEQEPKQKLSFEPSDDAVNEMAIGIISEDVDLWEIRSHIDQILEIKAKSKQSVFDINSAVDDVIFSKIDESEDE